MLARWLNDPVAEGHLAVRLPSGRQASGFDLAAGSSGFGCHFGASLDRWRRGREHHERRAKLDDEPEDDQQCQPDTRRIDEHEHVREHHRLRIGL